MSLESAIHGLRILATRASGRVLGGARIGAPHDSPAPYVSPLLARTFSTIVNNNAKKIKETKRQLTKEELDARFLELEQLRQRVEASSAEPDASNSVSEVSDTLGAIRGQVDELGEATKRVSRQDPLLNPEGVDMEERREMLRKYSARYTPEAVAALQEVRGANQNKGAGSHGRWAVIGISATCFIITLRYARMSGEYRKELKGYQKTISSLETEKEALASTLAAVRELVPPANSSSGGSSEGNAGTEAQESGGSGWFGRGHTGREGTRASTTAALTASLRDVLYPPPPGEEGAGGEPVKKPDVPWSQAAPPRI